MPAEVDFKHLKLLRPQVNVCGLATDMNWNDKTFVVNAAQYVAALKTVARDLSVFPAQFFVPDTPRFKTKKPIPAKDTFVFVSGYISRLDIPVLPTSGGINRFIVELDKVSFLGKKMAPIAPMESTCAVLDAMLHLLTIS